MEMHRDTQLFSVQRVRDFGVFRHKWNIHITLLHKRLKDLYTRKGVEQLQESEVMDNIKKIVFFLTQQGSCIFELTVIVTVCTKPVQAQARQNASIVESM